MNMDNPKVYTLCLLALALLLVVLIQHPIERNLPGVSSAKLLHKEQRQSLDGMRQYFLLSINGGPPFNLQVSPKVQCRLNDVVLLSKTVNTITQSQYYQFQSCHP